ncbi:MAG: FCD domain-containing protein [Oscillatoriales cyanobacterium C42_A2020_001]|nr:FCD domain-containing protein [Leptolyngbyaceae cyanobacterium C42_A2020_001]
MELKQRLMQKGATLNDILDHRFVVEPGVAALAADRATPQQLEDLQTLVQQMSKVVRQFDEHRQLDTEFHLLIAKATQCDRLVSVVAGIHADLSDLLAIIPHSPAACLDSVTQHQQILQAIHRGEGDRARYLMADHITRTSSLLKGLLG